MAKKIHIEIDQAEVNKNVKIDVALIGDLRQVLGELLPRVDAGNRAAWLSRIQELKGDWRCATSRIYRMMAICTPRTW